MSVHLIEWPHGGVAVDAVPEVGLGGVTRLVRVEMRGRALKPGYCSFSEFVTRSCKSPSPQDLSLDQAVQVVEVGLRLLGGRRGDKVTLDLLHAPRRLHFCHCKFILSASFYLEMYKGANYLYSNKKKRVFLVERCWSTDDIEFLHK